MFIDFLNPNTRPPKNGWFTGHYIGRCRNCSKSFTGAKGAWTCSDCAYDFDEQLQYEQLWRDFVWPYTKKYLMRKLFEKQNKIKQEQQK